jgi:hypothetical protein
MMDPSSDKFGYRVLALACLLIFASPPVWAQPKQGQTSFYVKVQTTGSKPDDAGKQKIVVTLDIDEKIYLFANTQDEDFKIFRTIVEITAKGEKLNSDLVYPPGTLVEDKVLGKYNIYQGKVTITGVAQRVPGDKNPLEINVRIYGAQVRYRF